MIRMNSAKRKAEISRDIAYVHNILDKCQIANNDTQDNLENMGYASLLLRTSSMSNQLELATNKMITIAQKILIEKDGNDY